MIDIHRRSCWIAAVILCSIPAYGQQEEKGAIASIELRLMSFNIRNGKAKDGENKWENRKEFVRDVIKQHKLDVVGLQEAFHFQLQYIQQSLAEFSVIGEGRDGGNQGEYSAILYRKQRFTAKESGTFWLSDTPEKKSRSWGNRYLRICTWVRLVDNQTSRAFYVYNTHFDHQSQNARFESAKLIANRIAERKFSDPYVLMGDFNADETNEVVQYLKGRKLKSNLKSSPIQLKDTFREIHPESKDVGTGGGFEGRKTGPKIDYIFVPANIKTADIKTIDANIIRTNRSGKFPSDHFPVFAQVEIRPNQSASKQELSIDANFEGASVRVLEIDQDAYEIKFMPGGDPERGWPCWWYFRVKGLTKGSTITLRLQGSTAAIEKRKPLSALWAMPKHAAFSTDGKLWQQTAAGQREKEWMVYQLKPDSNSVFVAWGPPYTPSTASKFVKEFAKKSPHAFAKELCKSREGRSVPMLYVKEGDLPIEKRFGIWIQARQHAWESGSSWVAHGFMEWLLGNGEEPEDKQATWLRQNAEIFVVPIMDVDNTATGNGGKAALPHDHNRDWSAKPHWNEVRAAQQKVGKLIEQGRMDVFIDLHNPAPGDPTFFYVLPKDMLKEPTLKLRDRFIDLAYARISKIKPLMPMSKNPKVTGPGYHPLWRQISSNWVAMHGNPKTVSLCLETMWNYKNSTTTGYRAVGAKLAAATREYLAERTLER